MGDRDDRLVSGMRWPTCRVLPGVLLLATVLTSAGHGAAAPRAAPGSLLWHVEERGWGVPAADATQAYFLTVWHDVQARDLATGALRWRAPTGRTGPVTGGSMVALAGDGLVLAADDGVAAFERRDGSLRWRFVPDEGYAPGPYLGAVSSELAFAGSPAGRLYAIDLVTGRARWSLLVADEEHSTVYQPAADADLVAAGYTTFTAPARGGVVAVDPATGRERWHVPFPPPEEPGLDSGWGGGPVLAGDVAIAARADGVVFAFDRRSGAVRWTLPRWPAAPDDRAEALTRDLRPLAAAGGQLLVGSLSGGVIAYGLEDHVERWRYASPDHGSVAFRLTADANAVYVPYIDGGLVVLDAERGRERWRTPPRYRGLIWPPARAGPRLLAADFDAGFFAFAR